MSETEELTEQRGVTAESAREFAMAIPATDPLYICLIKAAKTRWAGE